jgi:hypothetical protein
MVRPEDRARARGREGKKPGDRVPGAGEVTDDGTVADLGDVGMAGGTGAGDDGGAGNMSRAGEVGVGGPGDAGGAGQRILRADVWGTVAFGVVAVAAAAWPDPLLVLAVPLDLVLFAVGTGAFLWAYGVAVSRSRYEVVTMGGAFFPGRDVIQVSAVRTLRLALAAQVVVALAVAAARPFTAAAFAVLVPMLGLGLMALYGARFGRFATKPAEGDDPGVTGPPGR